MPVINPLAPSPITATVNAIAAVSTDAIVIANNTPSTAAIPVQQSGRLRLRAHAWNTTTPADNTDDWWIESVPVSGAAPSGLLKFGKSLNGGATTFPLTLSTLGVLTIAGNLISLAGVIQAASAGGYSWANGTNVISSANAQINLNNNGTTAGVGLDFGTDTILKIRTRAQTGYATIDALGFRVSGVAGVSFGPSVVTSITVVNGIITAIS